MIVGSKIKEKRMKMGLSQEQLGDKLGVTKVSICGYEKGTRIPNLKNFVDLLDILDLTPNELLGREVKTICDNNVSYTVFISKADLQILKELKIHSSLYNKLAEDPRRSIELIDRLYK